MVLRANHRCQNPDKTRIRILRQDLSLDAQQQQLSIPHSLSTGRGHTMSAQKLSYLCFWSHSVGSRRVFPSIQLRTMGLPCQSAAIPADISHTWGSGFPSLATPLLERTCSRELLDREPKTWTDFCLILTLDWLFGQTLLTVRCFDCSLQNRW